MTCYDLDQILRLITFLIVSGSHVMPNGIYGIDMILSVDRDTPTENRIYQFILERIGKIPSVYGVPSF